MSLGKTWRETNHVTVHEAHDIAMLLCDHDPRDLALMVVRLQDRLNAIPVAMRTVQTQKNPTTGDP